MARWIGWLAVAVALAACGSKDKDEPAPGGGKVAAPVEAGLWALAPSDAAAGFVVQDGAIARLYEVIEEVERVAKAHPGAARLYGNLRAEMPRGGFDPFDRAAVEQFGIDTKRGFAIFFDADMEVIAGTLPFASLDAVTKIGGGEAKQIDGRKVFQMSDGDVCTEAAGRVMCGRDLKTIDDGAAEGAGSALARAVAALPGDRRGQVEFAMDTQRVKEIKAGIDASGGVLTDTGLLAVTARFGVGVLTVDTSFEGKLAVLTLRPASEAPKAFRGLDRGSVGLVRAHLDLAPLFALSPPPPSMPLGGGVDLRRDLIDQLSGDFALVTRGTAMGGGLIGIGLKDDGPAAKALPVLCKMAAGQIPGATIQPSDAGCSVKMPLPPDDFLPPAVLGSAIAGSVAVRDGALWAEVGDTSAAEGVTDASPHTAGLLKGASLVIWGRSFDPLAAVSADVRAAVDELLAENADANQRENVAAARWALAHIAEAALAVDERDGWYHARLVVVSYAADPADAYHAYEAAVQKDFAGDHDGYRAAMKQLADGDGLVARQAKIVEAGAPPAGVGSGILAAISIPAFLKYIKKSKTAEARVALQVLHASADAYWADNQKLPASVGPTPPLGSCCDECAPDPKLWDHPSWKLLQFAMHDPHYYSYQFIADGPTYTVRAMGDLDCDGVYSTFEMYGGGDGNAPAGIFRQNELE